MLFKTKLSQTNHGGGPGNCKGTEGVARPAGGRLGVSRGESSGDVSPNTFRPSNLTRVEELAQVVGLSLTAGEVFRSIPALSTVLTSYKKI